MQRTDEDVNILYVDYRTGSKEYLPLIRGELTRRKFSPNVARAVSTSSDDFGNSGGDFLFLGNGPEGMELIGIELKKVQDFIASTITDDRLQGFQLPNMVPACSRIYLIIEGSVRCADSNHKELQILRKHPMVQHLPDALQWYNIPLGKTSDGASRLLPYYRYMAALHSLSVGYNLQLIHTDNDRATANAVCAIWSFWQKSWDEHQFNTPRLIKSGSGKTPTRSASNVYQYLTRDVNGVGPRRATTVMKKYSSLRRLMGADETELAELVGKKLAEKIMKGFG